MFERMSPNSTPTAVYAGSPAGAPGHATGSDSPGNQGGPGGRGMMGPGMRGGETSVIPAISDMWAMMGQRVIVADASGRVVSDSSGDPQEQSLSAQQLAAGEPIQVLGQPAGTVLVTAADTSPESPAGEFLAAMNRSILIAVLAAGAVAMVLGGVLFFQITAPVRKLKVAAGAIAAGDLSQRVPVTTRDELGDLAVTFNSMAESLGRAEAQRKRMVADVAHELRTPLSVMQANLEAMEDGLLPLNAEQVASLHEETALLSRLVADLRLLSLAEAGELKLERAAVDPAEVVRRAADRLSQQAQERNVTLTTETQPDLPPVFVDTDRVSQVIGNLIANSLRYTPAGGTITVDARSESLSAATATRRRRPGVLVSVTDTGSGIPEADLPHIFDRFYRGRQVANACQRWLRVWGWRS